MRSLTSEITSSMQFYRMSPVKGKTTRKLKNWIRSPQRRCRLSDPLRAELARELHDRAGWHISALNYKLYEAEKSFSDKTVIRELRAQLAALNTSLREITNNVRHPDADQDLIGSLAALCREWTRVTQIAANLETHVGSLAVPKLKRETVLATIQEALTNIAKHSEGVRRVDIKLSATLPGWIAVTVADDGAGFDLPAAGINAMPHSNGLRGIEERLTRIGSVLSISRGSVSGTVLGFRFQLIRRGD